MTKVNVGTIGHVDHGKTIHYITAHPPCDPIDCGGWNTKKSKGDKHRDRAERRRKWGI